MIQFDKYFSDGLKPPTSNCWGLTLWNTSCIKKSLHLRKAEIRREDHAFEVRRAGYRAGEQQDGYLCGSIFAGGLQRREGGPLPVP